VILRRRRRRARRGSPVELAPVVGELFAVAQVEATACRHDYIGTEHVLLALLGRDDEAGRLLRELGLDAGNVRRDVLRILGAGPPPETAFDADALAAIGVDLAAVRERVEATFGEGALERARRAQRGCIAADGFGVSPRLKRALEAGRRAALERHEELSSAHVLSGLAQQRDAGAARILDGHGISSSMILAALGQPGTSP
jgi:ATP-dependent Clp protease ATP-binding subunit ClpA